MSRVNRDGKRDATGAFIPEGKAWAAANHGHIIAVDGEQADKGAMRHEVIYALTDDRFQGCTQIAFFCHGWRSGLQFGFHGRTGAACLAAAIQGCTEQATVILYACSAGQWFAGELARNLGDGFQVWSHDARGHTTRNPRLVWSRGDQTVEVWHDLTWRKRAKLRELMASNYRLMLGDQTPQTLSEILDPEPSDTLEGS